MMRTTARISHLSQKRLALADELRARRREHAVRADVLADIRSATTHQLAEELEEERRAARAARKAGTLAAALDLFTSR
ncbi:hypothetical protein [Ancylobacter mangrovi]|uniref:hypothetical protein n=1 Tax=Ancylobacter mangrovi TaxID=2972472 RepID=UPI002161925F|nr:hypothetical protein [Ancylobacter mangrovi]MCS0501417.1 hypothetical protein [Ancylobacter mangrovi]